MTSKRQYDINENDHKQLDHKYEKGHLLGIKV